MTLCFTVGNISNCGGTERVMLAIASELCRKGYDVHVMSYYGNGKPFFECDGRIKIHTLLTAVEARWMSTHPKYLVLKSKLIFRRIKPEVVIDTDLLTANLTIPAVQGTRIRHVVWDNFSYEYFKRVYHEHIALEKVKSNGSHLITLTHKDRELYISEQNVNVEKIHQIYNPLTFDGIDPLTHSDNVVLSVGRFAHEKGFDMLLKAWEKIEEKVPDWSLEIWGDTGIDTGDVHKTFCSLNLSRAKLHPSTDKIRERFENAGIYVLPSRHEGLGLVLLEASACSLPLIAFDCPNGPREIIKDGYNGILVEPENVDALAEAILKLIKDQTLREQMGINAYTYSNEFSMEHIIPKWITLLELVCE